MDRSGIQSHREGADRVDMKATTHRHAAGNRRPGVLGSRGRIVCAVVPAMGLIACGSDAPRGLGPIDEPFSVEASVHPIWRETPPPEPAVQDSAAPGEPRSLTIYLDMSRPMAGFLPLGAASPPREGSGGTNEFRAVAQWVPDHLTRVYATAALRWRGVGRDIRDLSEYPRFERSLFDATASRLDMAIQEALADLKSGRSEGAALISDLLGTGELTGALAVSRYFEGWLNSEGVRTSEFHLGLVGVKASYWGGTSSNCAPSNGLGCWYSERGRGWRRLDDVVLARISHTGKPEASEGRVEAVTSVVNGVGAKKKPPAGVFGAAGKEIDGLKGPSLVSGRSGAVSVGWNKCSGAAGSYPGNRAWTRANAAAEGCAESMATLTRRTETMTRAAILRSLSRSVPAVARASWVP